MTAPHEPPSSVDHLRADRRRRLRRARARTCPVTPQQIADDAVAAARAGAAVVHVHVRHPETGVRSRDVALYREAVALIRASDVDVVLNLTAGMGGDLVVDEEDPLKPVEGTDLVNAMDRLPHVEELRPDIATLDCGSYNFGDGQRALRLDDRHAARRREALPGARASSPSWRSSTPGSCGSPGSCTRRASSTTPPLVQLCMGVPYGAPADPGLLQAMVEPAARRRPVHLVRARPRPAAVGGAVGAARRPRPRRARGQPLPRARGEGDQRRARRTRGHDRRVARRARSRPPDAGPRDLRPAGHAAVSRTVACVGAGVIGGGWAALLPRPRVRRRRLGPRPGRRGPPAPDRRRRLARPRPSSGSTTAPTGRGCAWRTRWPRPARAPGSSRSARRRTWTSSAACSPSSSTATGDDVVVASSTSGLPDVRDGHRGARPAPPRRRAPVQPAVPHPARRGGRRPGDRARGRRPAPRTSTGPIGKSVIEMDREVPGFVANRLQEALWREALHMVANGEATVEQIDTVDHRGTGPALAGPRPVPDLPSRRRRGRHGAHARPLRAVAARALDAARGARADAASCATRWSRGTAAEAGTRAFADLVAERDRAVIAVRRAVEAARTR